MKDLLDLRKSEFRAGTSFRTSPIACGLCPSLVCLPALNSNLISHSPHCHPSLHSNLLFSSNNPNSKVIPRLLHLKLPLLKYSGSRFSWLGFCSVLRSGFPDHLFENPSTLHSLSISLPCLHFFLVLTTV